MKRLGGCFFLFLTDLQGCGNVAYDDNVPQNIVVYTFLLIVMVGGGRGESFLILRFSGE